MAEDGHIATKRNRKRKPVGVVLFGGWVGGVCVCVGGGGDGEDAVWRVDGGGGCGGWGVGAGAGKRVGAGRQGLGWRRKRMTSVHPG